VAAQALLDGPTEVTGLIRQIVPFKRMALTDLKVKIPRNARAKTLKKAWEVSNSLNHA
jgi:large subunit ribosomal protein L14e